MNYIIDVAQRDDICAVSTPPGVGGIAVIRVSGPRSIEIVDSIWRGKMLHDAKSHTARLGMIFDPADGTVLDQCVATVFRAPGSFTGDNVVELSIHGSRWLQQEVVRVLIGQGCRLAEPGEFTRRAFLSGKMDLAEAEGVADVIASTSRAAHRVAVNQMRGGLSAQLKSLHDRLLELAALLELELDFSEEDVEFASRDHLTSLAQQTLELTRGLASTFAAGKALREGVPVVLVGETNAGKSTLLNALARHDRAIVSDIHGTTRDTIEENIQLEGIPFRLVDTAGIRETTDPIEALGIERSYQALSTARIIILVVDGPALADGEGETGGCHGENAAGVGTYEGRVSSHDSLSFLLSTISEHRASDAALLICINKSDLLTISQQEEIREVFASSQDGLELGLGGEACRGVGDELIFDSLVSDDQDKALSLPYSQEGLHREDIASERQNDLIFISARDGKGVDVLRESLVAKSGLSEALSGDSVVLTNLRHYQSLEATSHALESVIDGLAKGLSGDFVAQDLREALHHLSTLTGSLATPDILSTIFSRFCIGK